MASPNFTCLDCMMPTDDRGEYYMLKNEVWALTGLGTNDGMLCVGCVEDRLGRKLGSVDFSDATINKLGHPVYGDKSPRLVARLTDSPSVP
jgi:hypothetical protein